MKTHTPRELTEEEIKTVSGGTTGGFAPPGTTKETRTSVPPAVSQARAAKLGASNLWMVPARRFPANGAYTTRAD
jgi:hypothetical protein